MEQHVDYCFIELGPLKPTQYVDSVKADSMVIISSIST